MPQTIAQAQRSLLKSGDLNNIGSKNEPNEFNLDNVTIALVKVGGSIVIDAQGRLQAGGHVSSGALAESIKVNDPQVAGKKVTVNIEALHYYAYLNKGVRGTKSGAGVYAFKNSFPSKAMVQSISAWMQRAGLSVRNVKQNTYGKLEGKRASISQLSGAYGVARSILQHGIKASGFFDAALKTGQVTAKKELAAALKIDIINSLPNKLG